MSLKLRPYQNEALDGLFAWWQAGRGNGLIVLPTGTGKALVNAEICRVCMQWDANVRIVMLTHVQELVGQNVAELLTLWPDAPVGIFSAGLGKRQIRQITFASIQSVYSKAERFGHVDIVIVDEAHLIPHRGDGMYRRFLAELAAINPDLKVVGLTATPFRLGAGRLDEGEGRLFEGVAYDYSIRTAIEEGYLTPLTTKATKTQFDLTGVGTVAGDYKANELEKAVDTKGSNEGAVREVIAAGGNRSSWLFFCAGIEHAQHVAELVRGHGHSCEVITSETPADDRRRIIAEFKAGKIRALASMNVLTTGFNAPAVDLMAMLRPTKSRGLYIQMCGRGTRNVYAPGFDLETREGRLDAIKQGTKPNCLVLDFARNIETHGPVDLDVAPKAKKPGQGEAPVKVCPGCECYVHASKMVCDNCGHQFERKEKQFAVAASREAILTSDIRPEWVKVASWLFREHEKIGKPISLKVTYDIRHTTVAEWVCFEHQGFAREKAHKWWRKNGGQNPVPRTVQEAIQRRGELVRPAELLVRKNGKYHEVVAARAVPGVQPRGALVGFDAEVPF